MAGAARTGSSGELTPTVILTKVRIQGHERRRCLALGPDFRQDDEEDRAAPYPANRHPASVPARNGTTDVSPSPTRSGTITRSRTSVTVPSFSGNP